LASVPSQREERFSRPDGPPRPRKRGGGIYWLLVLPFFGTFFPWIYNSSSPELIGIPFFYWYQMVWIPITVIITVMVYRATSGRS
jgi:apolipoprotein N-acyltransferase